MIDSHCHLNFDSYAGRREEIVVAAKSADVHTIVNIGIDLKTSQECIALADRFDGLFATVGVHPHDAKDVSANWDQQLKKLSESDKVVAIGEIGLDFYRDISPRKTQREVFRRQLDLACELNLPIVIHSRESMEETVEIVSDFASSLKGGVFHCFPGSIDDALRVIDMGFVVSFGGVITFEKARMAKVAAETPLEAVILETDAPFLTPVPYRGKTNKPEYVTYVYRKLAALKDLSQGEVERAVDRTCQKLFGLVETFGG
jgi:TatD DNase family protein